MRRRAASCGSAVSRCRKCTSSGPHGPTAPRCWSLPGGGYEFLSVQNEGLDAAERFNADRTTVFVLTYRLPGRRLGEPVDWSPLQDAQRAMRLIRARAAEFRIDPARLGVLGFSAGGHLAADLAVSHDERAYAPVDEADRLSARPAFVGLIYPVISLDPATRTATRAPTCSGRMPHAELIAARSPALHVTAETPPSFVAAAFDDGFVPIANSLDWIEACRERQGVGRSASLRRGRPRLRPPSAAGQSRARAGPTCSRCGCASTAADDAPSPARSARGSPNAS